MGNTQEFCVYRVCRGNVFSKGSRRGWLKKSVLNVRGLGNLGAGIASSGILGAACTATRHVHHDVTPFACAASQRILYPPPPPPPKKKRKHNTLSEDKIAELRKNVLLGAPLQSIVWPPSPGGPYCCS